MGGIGTVIPTEQGGLLALTRTAIDDVRAGDLWHEFRDSFPRTIIEVRNVRGGRRITDEFGCSRVFRHGSEVRTAVLIGGDMPGETS